jgi:hypothetical protein
MFAQNALAGAQKNLSTSVQRLSSGLRINSAADDAAGLSVAQNMQSQINAINMAARNVGDATNLLTTTNLAVSTQATITQLLTTGTADMFILQNNETNSLRFNQTFQLVNDNKWIMIQKSNNIDYNINTNNKVHLNVTIGHFNNFKKSKNSDNTTFYDWLQVNTDYISDIHLLNKINNMFSLDCNNEKLDNIFNNIKIANGPIKQQEIENIMKSEDFIFL